MTDFIDLTMGINQLRNAKYEINNVDECCNYKYQILDKFCASRNAVS